MAERSQRSSSEENVAPGQGYGGDATAKQAWEILQQNPDAVLVDVRTQPEWVFVGVPDLGPLGKRALFIPWQLFPSMQVNSEFVKLVQEQGAKPDAPVLFLCRSGARSKAAAIAATQAGFTRAYNIAGGFEGPHDAKKHRGNKDGWKASDLPWIQD
jgi:rhodanese-related sulfurtransferase